MTNKSTDRERVGILTRHCYPNYGSLLQARALTDALASLGFDTEVIDYIPVTDRARGIVGSSLRESRMRSSRLRRVAYRIVQGPGLLFAVLKFARFRRRLIAASAPYGTPSEVADALGQYNTVVTGSDQVWNRIHGELDATYFLTTPMPGGRRISYAASFGTAGPDPEHEAQIFAWLNELDRVSVRERSSAEALRERGVHCEIDPDPVLLHDRGYWNDFSRKAVRASEPYLLVYQLHNTPLFNEELARLQARTGLPVRRVTVDVKQWVRHRASDYLVSPEHFVALFRDASLVVTDSFHGTAFSLIFGRPLRVVLPMKNSARLQDMVESVGVGASLTTVDDANYSYSTTRVDSVLMSARREARQRLVSSIRGTD